MFSSLNWSSDFGWCLSCHNCVAVHVLTFLKVYDYHFHFPFSPSDAVGETHSPQGVQLIINSKYFIPGKRKKNLTTDSVDVTSNF